MQTSDYLKFAAHKHIEGEINIDEVKDLIKSYYQSKNHRELDDDKNQEADKVTADWKEQPHNHSAPNRTNGTNNHKRQNKLHTENANIRRLVGLIGNSRLSVKQMMEGVGPKDRDNFLNLYLNPAILEGYGGLL